MSFFRRVLSRGLLSVALLAYGTGAVWAGAMGMVADNTTKSVTVFDADNDTVIGSVFLPQSPTPSSATGDCVITPDQKLGFVSDFQFRVWVIDLESSPPSLAAGTNPIFIRNRAEDLVVTPDGKYLVACDGSNAQPVVLIDIAARAQVAAYNTGSDCNCVDVCPDGTILVGSVNQQKIRRLTITDLGQGPVFVPTGDEISFGGNNVYCAPDGQSGVIVRGLAQEIVSFTLPDMTLVDRRPLTGRWGVSGAFSPDGTRFYTRSVDPGNDSGKVDVYSIDTATGQLGTSPLLSFPVGALSPDQPGNNIFVFFGMEQMALHPNGDKLYVTERNVVSIYDPQTGLRTDQFRAPQALQGATGICIQKAPFIEVLVDVKPGSLSNPLNLKSKGVLPIAVLSTPDFDALTIDPASVLVGDPVLIARSGASVAPVNDTADDVNDDGLVDLLLFIDVGELVDFGAADADTEAVILTGETTSGVPVMGGDFVNVVAGSSKGKK